MPDDDPRMETWSKPFISENESDRGHIDTFSKFALFLRSESIEPSEPKSVFAAVFSLSELKLATRCPVKITFYGWAIAFAE
jgi:hypothetical protein